MSINIHENVNEECDCCSAIVDERSLQLVGKYYVCNSCFRYYSEEEIIEKIEN